jgi:hypothetical protein
MVVSNDLELPEHLTAYLGLLRLVGRDRVLKTIDKTLHLSQGEPGGYKLVFVV